MVNTAHIKYNKTTGEPVGLHVEGQTTFNQNVNQSFAFIQLSISGLLNGMATLNLPNGANEGNFNFNPAPHADDPVGDVGRVNYDLIYDLLDHTKQEHDEPAPTRQPTQVEQDINSAFVSIGNIFPRLVKLEKAFVPPIIFDKWVVQGQELRLNRGGSTGDDCIIGITNGFGGLCPSRIEGQPEESQERILTIEVNGSTHLLHIFSRGDTGRIADAIASNSQVPTLGTSRPESGGESG